MYFTMISNFCCDAAMVDYFKTRHSCHACGKTVSYIDEVLGRELLLGVSGILGFDAGGEFEPVHCIGCLVEIARDEAIDAGVPTLARYMDMFEKSIGNR